MTRALHIYAGDARVGTLNADNDLWSLEYDENWAQREDTFDLSPALSKAARRHVDGGTDRPVQWYFDNLLPEEGLRELTAREAGLDQHDAFALLEHLGAESAGSLTLLRPEVALPDERALRPLAPADLSERIRRLPRASLTSESPKRMSAAGAQHKLLVVRKGGDLYEPVGATPSTHILKPDHPDTGRFPTSAFLEWLTMTMAAAAGLDVPTVAYLRVPEPVYVIERFDRRVAPAALRPETGDRAPDIARLHAIDACQLLNKARSFKHAAANVPALRSAAERCGDVLIMPSQMFRWLVFNLLVANDDNHLKNLSFLVGPGTISLAPFYDMLATGLYSTRTYAGDQADWPNTRMTLELPGGIRRFADVTRESVLQSADILGVPRQVAQRLLEQVVTRALAAFDREYARAFPHGDAPGDAGPPAHEVQADAQVQERNEGVTGAERRVLRAMRHIVLPGMRARLLA